MSLAYRINRKINNLSNRRMSLINIEEKMK